jgi:uncharacterized protein YcbX
MAGVPAESAHLGLHGLEGDRRFAFRRVGDSGGFPFLTASRFPELLTYRPSRFAVLNGESLPTHVRTPAGDEVELRGEELRREIATGSGTDVELMMFKNGIFDDGIVSLMSVATIAAIGREAGREMDRRRVRANFVLETGSQKAFVEDDWVGSTLVFGEEPDAPAVSITSRDERCVMINLDPDSGRQDARFMKAVVRMNDNFAGVYGTVVRAGSIRAGHTVRLV